MTDHIPQAVLDGLAAARRASIRRGDKLCVHDGDDVYRIIRFWADGMTLDAKHRDKLRGRIEIYDGARHLYQALVINSEVEGAECVFTFKWLHPVHEQPAVDFVRENDEPVALITR